MDTLWSVRRFVDDLCFTSLDDRDRACLVRDERGLRSSEVGEEVIGKASTHGL